VKTLNRLAAPLLLALGLIAPSPARTQEFPSRPITIIVPFPAGGAVDVLIRPVAQFLRDRYKVSVIVENKTGAGGNLGTAAVAKAAPDGYTLVAGTVGTQVINGLLEDVGFDGIASFAPITANAIVPNVLLVHAGLPVNNLGELIAYARQNPGVLDYASAGIGSPSHLAGELLAAQAGIQIVHVPYRGAPPVVTDLVSGRVKMFFNNLPSSLPLLKAGGVRAIAVTTPTRAAAMSAIPTMMESGLPRFEVVTWYGILAPQGTPAAIVERLNRDITDALRAPDVAAVYQAQGVTVVGNSVQAFADLLQKDKAKWAAVIRDAGIKVGK